MNRSAFLLSLLLGGALVGCLSADDEAAMLDESVGELSAWQWPDDTQIVGKESTRQPALAWFGSRLHMVYTDYSSSSSTALKQTRFNGSSWTTSVSLGVSSDSHPALVDYDGSLRLIYKPVGQNRLMMMTSTTASATTWSSPVTIGRSLGTRTASAPSALAFGGNLYVAYCSQLSDLPHVLVDRFDGATWTAVHDTVASSQLYSTCNSVVMAAMPDTGEVEVLYNVIGSGGGVKPYIMRQRVVIGRSSTVWYSPTYTGMTSFKPISVVTCDGITHLVHGGDPDITEIWWSFRSNNNWVAGTQVPNQWSGAGAALGCFNGTKTVMVHNVSGGTHLMQSIFGP
ncbi:MAG: hypothetical protein IPL61_18195 [Myxococcales bacterium]|nr:hypothetical protein [Myxococcales bacterium]